MNNHIKLVIASLVLFVAFAWADGPATLGNMIQLGQSTVANRPASSSTIKGALLFDLDAGVPIYNDGTAWQSMGGSSGAGAYWYDGGAGFITATEGMVKYGAGANFSEDPSTTGQALTLQHTGGTTMFPRILWRDGTGVAVADIGSSAFNGYTAYTGLFLRVHKNGNVPIRFGNTTLPIYGSSGPFLGGYAYGDFGGTTAPYGLALYAGTVDNAISLKNGGRLDFGSGTIDYAQSNGGGITSPGTWTSTLAAATGPGLRANGAQLDGAAFSAFTSTLNSNYGGAGALIYNTTMRQHMALNSRDGFRPLGSGVNNVTERQVFSTRISGTGRNTYPELNERVRCDSFGGTGATMQMYWSRLATASTTVTSGRTMIGLATGADEAQRAFGHTACSSSATAADSLVYGGPTSADSWTSFCWRVAAGANVSNSNIWVALTSALPANNATTIGNPYFGFRFADSIGATWYACYFNGSTDVCANTGINATTANVNQTLCAYQIGTNTLTWTIDGLVTNTAAATTNASNLYPLIMLDSTNSTAKTMYTGAFQVEAQ